MKKYNLKKKIGIGLVSLATILTLKCSKAQTNVDKFVETFPEKIPGAERVDKYLKPGSSRCIIHIRQPHYGKGLNRLELTQIDNAQKNIYEILGFLKKTKNIQSVRFDSLVRVNKKEEYPDYYNSKVIEEYNQIKKQTGKEYVGGGGEKMVLEERLSAKPAETNETFSRAIRYLETIGPLGLQELLKRKKEYPRRYKEYLKYVSEDREDALLELISDDKETFSYIVYGAGHALGGTKSCGMLYDLCLFTRENEKDNLNEWNEKHPKEITSLIEIMPEGA